MRHPVLLQTRVEPSPTITFVDIDGNPVNIEAETLDIELTCSNHDLPSMLSCGVPGGDLFPDGDFVKCPISFLRKPTRQHCFQRGGGAHWRLISHLSLNYLSLETGGLEALREMLTLYDLSGSASSQRQIGAIAAIGHNAATAWLPGDFPPGLARGIEVRLSVDEQAFAASGIHTFASVMALFFGLYTSANSFTQLAMVSKQTGEDLLRCLPRSGALRLI